MNKDLLTIPEFCEAIGIGRSFVYTLLKRGDLTAIKIGRRTFIKREAVANWLGSLDNYPAKSE